MGMAAYGKITKYKNKLRKIYYFDQDNLFNLNLNILILIILIEKIGIQTI